MDIFVNKAGTPLNNFWNHFHFHPTDAIEDEWGQKILNDVAADKAARTVRMYTMFEDIVTRDAEGNLQFDFTENDVRMDYMISKGFNLLVSYNFIPACMARDSSLQSNVAKNKTRYKGKMIITSPPTDYAEWQEVCYRYTQHIVERYGVDTVKNWYLQCLNEPDIPSFWMGDLGRSMEDVQVRLNEYIQLYDNFVAGVLRVSDQLKLGGPGLAHDLMFLAGLLRHLKDKDIRMDFLSVHSYGTGPKPLNEGTKHYHVDNNIRRIRTYRDILYYMFPEGKELVVDEWGAASAGFFNIEECPYMIMRETPALAAYFGKLVTRLIELGEQPDKLLICLSGQHEMVVDFSGFRNFFTMNHIRKPIYNAYVVMNRLGNELLDAKTEGDTTVLATKEGETVSVLLARASENFDKTLPDADKTLRFTGLTGKRTATVYRIDRDHCDPYGEYRKLCYTDPLTQEQIEHLRQIGMLKVSETVELVPEGDTAVLTLTLPCDSLTMIQF